MDNLNSAMFNIRTSDEDVPLNRRVPLMTLLFSSEACGSAEENILVDDCIGCINNQEKHCFNEFLLAKDFYKFLFNLKTARLSAIYELY